MADASMLQQLMNLFPAPQVNAAGNIAEAVGSGLAGVAAGFNKRSGADLQQSIFDQYYKRQQTKAAVQSEQQKTHQAVVGNLLSSLIQNKEMSNLGKEYQDALASGYSGTFQDFAKMRNPPPLGDPYASSVIPLINMMAPIFSKIAGQYQPSPTQTQNTNSSFFTTPEGITIKPRGGK